MQTKKFHGISASLIISITSVFISSAQAQQTVTFDINSATVSGGDVTQTVTTGGSVFELTASHSSGLGAALFNATEGNFDTSDPTDDLVFFSNDTSQGPPDQFWTVSVTQDGAAIDFTLDQVGFASFGGGHSFDLINNLGQVITDDFAVPATGAGLFTIDDAAVATGIRSFNIASGSNSLATVQVDFNDIVISTAAVPEPSSAALLAIGGVAMAIRRRRS